MKIGSKKVFIIAGLLFFCLVFFHFSSGTASKTFSDLSSEAKLLYSIFGKTFFSDVYVYYPSGKLKKISPSDGGVYYQPHINAQGDKVVFYGNEIGSPRIWIVDLKNGEGKALTPETSGDRHPVFSWDGLRIAFASDRSHHQNHERIEYMRGNGLPPADVFLNLFVMDINGQHTRQITFGSFQDQRPAFSPDGKTLAFVSNRGGDRRLWTIQLDGVHEPLPLQKVGWGYRPWYAADGQWIYFFTDVNNRHRICKISVNGGDIIPLPNDLVGTSHGPFVDAGRNVVLMHSRRDGMFGIWELPLNGSEPRQIVLPELDEFVSHPTRSKNGILAFDVCRRTFVRKLGSFFESIAFQLKNCTHIRILT